MQVQLIATVSTRIALRRRVSFFAQKLRVRVSQWQARARSLRCKKWGVILPLILASCTAAIVPGCGSLGDKMNATGGTLVFSGSSISFGSVMVGHAASASLTVSNGSTNPVQISQLQVTGQYFSLTAQNNMPVTVAANSTYNVNVQFAPGATGTATGALTVMSNAASGGSATIALSGNGESSATVALSSLSCASGTMTVPGTDACTVTLTGTVGTSALAVSLSSNDSAVTVPSSVSVPAEASSAGFTATVLAVTTSQTATLTASAGGVTKSYALQLSPSGPALTLQSTSVSFGDVTLNTMATQTVTLTSSGTAPLMISAGTVTAGKGFSLSGVSFPATLNPGQTAALSIEFDPAVSGAVTGTVTLTDNTSTGNATIAVTGGEATSYEVDLTWDAPSSSSDPVVGYNVYRATGNSATYQLLNSSVNAPTSYADTTVQNGTAYSYYVESVDASGNQSTPSNTWSVTIP